MSLPIGTRVGPYEITGTLGAGGMGEVYRARDSRLGRDVALKVLPELFATDPERLARFEREAQVLAALKHPNIGAIYGLEEGPSKDGPRIRALVLELIDGDTLADRIARGAIPMDEALPIATQIAEALAAAHEQGVIHRDLKPSNIKVTPNGHAKVLDFGLAKLNDPTVPNSPNASHPLSMSPTITSPAATMAGVILGTAAYMAPEQAKGQAADKRSDVWAFGCVLFEMLTGRRAFEADDLSDTLALVLKGDPDWRALPADAYVTSLDSGETRRVVEADTGAIYDQHDAYLLFGRQGTLMAQSFDAKTLTLANEPFPFAEGLESGVFAGVLAFSVSENGTLAYGLGVSRAGIRRLVWIDRQGKVVATIGQGGNYRGPDLSPDGKRLAIKRRDIQGGDIWVIDTSRDTTSRFTFDSSQDNSSPIWSPDGSRIVFSSLRSRRAGLYVKPANGTGGEERLFESESLVVPVSWAPDGRSIVYVTQDPKTREDLWLLPLSGDRKPVPLVTTPFNDDRGQISPDGKWLAYDSSETGQAEVYVRPFPLGDGKWQVSTGGGADPRWRGDRHELFYMDTNGAGKLIAVDVRATGSMFDVGTPRALFDSGFVLVGGEQIGPRAYVASADGQRFLIPRIPASLTPDSGSSIAVVLNWAQGIQH